MKYLDEHGLIILWDKIKSYVAKCTLNDDSSNSLMYKNTSLTYDGTNYDKIDFQPFSEDTPNFELTMNIRIVPSENTELATIFCAHTYLTDTKELKGITIRVGNNSTDGTPTKIQIILDDKIIYLDVDTTTGVMINWTRIDNVSYLVYSYGTVHGCTCYIHDMSLDNYIHLGASEKEDGTIWRYAIGSIDYICIKRI